MKTSIKRALSLFTIALGCLSAINTSAQSISVTGSGNQSVMKDGVMHILTGRQAQFDISVTGLYSISVVSNFTYTFGSTTLGVEYELQNSTFASITPVTIMMSGSERTETFSTTMTYSTRTTSRTLSAQLPVHIWRTPSASISGNKTEMEVIGTASGLKWTVNPVGGYSGGWDITWTYNGTKTKGATYSLPTIQNTTTQPMEVIVEVDMVNYAPDGTTVWYSNKRTISVTILNDTTDPVATITGSKLTEYVAGNTSGLSWEVITTGGNANGWDVTWTYNDVKTKSKTFTMPNVANTGTSVIDLPLSVQMVNVDTQGDTIYNETKNINVHLYPAASCAIGGNALEENVCGTTAGLKWNATTVGGNASGWSVSWTCNNKTTTGLNFTMPTFTNHNSNTPTTMTVTMEARNMAPDGTTELYSYTKDIIVVIWRSISVTIDGNALNETVTGIAQGLNWTINTVGGYPQGWDMRWTYNGSTSNQKTFTLPTYTNRSQSEERLTVGLTVTNRYPGNANPFYSDTKTITIIVKPGPSVTPKELTIRGYNGSTATAELEVFNVYSGSTWSYDWTFNGKTTTTTQPKFNFTLPTATNSTPWTGTLKVVATNKVGGESRYVGGATQNLDVTSYTRGTASLVTPDSLNVYDGRTARFRVNKNGGYPEGWTYQWKVDNKTVATTTTTYCDITFDNSNVYTPEDHTVSVNATNTLDNATGYNSELRYSTITVWPGCRFPADFTFTDLIQDTEPTIIRIREGNAFRLSFTGMEGGYKSNTSSGSWSRRWNVGEISSTLSSPTFEAIMPNGGSSMSTQEVLIDAQLSNIGSTGAIWDYRTYSAGMIIYRKPATPTGLRVKGDGVSKTLVVTMPISDATLTSNEYYLVFGYVDRNGISHISSPIRQTATDCRYAHFTEPTSSVSYFVYSLWKYAGGESVTSGRRFFSSVDEAWDHSDFNTGNRSRVIEDFEVYTDAAGIDDIMIDGDDQSQTRMFDLNGREVTGTSLQRGVYLKEEKIGGTRVITKVLVK